VALQRVDILPQHDCYFCEEVVRINDFFLYVLVEHLVNDEFGAKMVLKSLVLEVTEHEVDPFWGSTNKLGSEF